jgi:formate hydrogenlyase subunit 6
MFKILEKTLRTGTVTTAYPNKPANLSGKFRGAPEFDLAQWRDARPADEACPTGAITVAMDRNRPLPDYGRYFPR